MVTSTGSRSSLPNKYDNFCTHWIASKWLWFIFQLPEMIGRRAGRSDARGSAMCVRCLSESLEPGQIAQLEQFERRAAASRDVVDLVVEAELCQRRGRIAATDNGERFRVGHCLSHRARTCGEAFVFEHAHRPVPEHRPRVHDDVAERSSRAGADVEPLG